MIDLYRRHSADCQHAEKGRAWTKCKCPIWAFGDLRGKEIRQSTKTRDWSRAARRVAEWEANPAKAVNAPLLEKAVDIYLKDCRARELAESTIESYEKTLEHLTNFRPGAHVDEVDLGFLTEFRGARKVEPSTGVKELQTIRAFEAFCVERKWLTENFAKRLKPPKVGGCPTLPFSRGEIHKIVDACCRLATDDPGRLEYVRLRAKAEVLVLMYAGLRISDMVKLERKTVDLKSGKMLLRVMKTGVPLYIRLHPDAAAALKALPEVGPYFFWTGRGKLITAVKNARRTIQRVLALAGVEGHPHRFRDTFSVGLLEQGEDLRTVQLLLGHKSIKTTEKHYAPYVKSFQRILDAATAKLDFTTFDETAETEGQNPYNSGGGLKTA
jgi:integrase/recombinase XerD